MEKETREEMMVGPGRCYQEEMLWTFKRNADPWLEPDSFMYWAVREGTKLLGLLMLPMSFGVYRSS